MGNARRPAYESEPQVNYLSQVLDEIAHGLIRVPRFQRPFVWTDEQRLELFRSVIDGTPIGSIMVWRTTRDIPCFDRLGPHRLPTPPPPSTPRTYLLDGHQRVSTLYAALYPPDLSLGYDEDQEALSGWQVFYDLKAGEFQMGGQSQPWWMPLYVVLNTRQHFAFLRTLNADNTDADLVDRADGIAKAIREYKIPVIPVVSDDLDSVTRTFQRINSQGTPMSDVHMVAALTFGDNFDLNARLAQARTELRAQQWDADERSLLRVCKIVVGLDLYDSTVDQVASDIKDKGDQALQEAVRYLVEAGRVLRSWGILSPKVVPYAHQPVLLAAAAMAAGGTVGPELARDLERWFWLTSFFGGANDSRVQAEHRRVVGLAEGIPPDFDDLRPEPLPWRFDFRHARSRAMLHLLARRSPLGLDGDSEAPALLAQHGHQAVGRIVAEPERRGMSNTDRPLASGPENVFIARPDRLTETRNYMRQSADQSWLDSHLIGSEAIARLRGGDPAGFLALRAEAIQEMERELIERLGGPEYRTRPTALPGGGSLQAAPQH